MLPGDQKMTFEHKFKTTAAVARYIGCSIWTIQRWVLGKSDYPLLRRFQLRDDVSATITA
jgi:hypothetical protein